MAEATIRDVARRAAVSVASVSRALNGLSNVHPDTRARVLAAAKDLGYVPHAGARSLSLARCRRVSEGCVAQLCMSLPRLESLDLSHCRQLGDVAAAAALRHCEEP